MTTKNDIFEKYFGNVQKATNTTTVVNTPKPIDLVTSNQGQRAEGNIDIDGFTTKLKELLDNAWEEDWGDFTVNGGKKDVIDNINLPLIVFDVINRVPSRNKAGIKARPTELQIDPTNDDYSLILHRKWFDVVVEFLVLDTTNKSAMQMADRLELFIDTYAGFFKEAGVSELIFLEEVDSRLSKNYIDGVPSRCIRYQLVIERIITERVRTTKDVRTFIQSTSLNRG